MARRLLTPLTAYVLAAITAAMYVSAIPLSRLAHLHSTVGSIYVLVLVGFIGVGLILVRQRPENPIGWVMLLGAFVAGVGADAGPYAIAAYRLHRNLPLPQIAVFLQPTWAPAILLVALAVMLFPDGELPRGRWRWIVAPIALLGLVWMLGAFAIAAETIALGHVVVEPAGDLKQI